MNWTQYTVNMVWQKATIVKGYDRTKWRKDACGAWISRAEYGDRSSKFGWEIDHINSKGSDNLSNLQPLNWRNNVAKSDGKLVCAVIGIGDDNFLT